MQKWIVLLNILSFVSLFVLFFLLASKSFYVAIMPFGTINTFAARALYLTTSFKSAKVLQISCFENLYVTSILN